MRWDGYTGLHARTAAAAAAVAHPTRRRSKAAEARSRTIDRLSDSIRRRINRRHVMQNADSRYLPRCRRLARPGSQDAVTLR